MSPRLGVLFHASPMAIAFTLDREFHEVNDALCAMSGYCRDELLGQSTRILYTSDAAYARVAERGYAQVAATGGARLEGQLRRKDGQIIDIALHLAALEPGDLTQGVIGSILDITAQQRARALLRARAEISEAVAAEDQDGILRSTLREALALTRSAAALLTFPAHADGAPGLEAQAALGADGELRMAARHHGNGTPAADIADASARCRRRSALAARTGAAAGLAQDDGACDYHALAVPLSRGEVVAALLAVADKQAPYLDAEAELLRELASMAADGLHALRARAALRTSEQRASLASDVAGVGIWDWDIQSGRISVNAAYLRMLGMHPGEHVDVEQWRALIHPDDRERMVRDVEGAMATDALRSSEFRLRTAAGRWCHILSRGRVCQRDARGQPLRMIGTHTDITELRRTEADLRTAWTWLEVALKAAGLGLYEVDLVSGRAEVDDRYLSQLGLSRDDAITLQRWAELIHPDDRGPLEQIAADAVSGRILELDTEYRMRHTDGGWRWILDRWRVYDRDDAGTITRVAGVHLDITERKRAEEALAELNRTLEQRVAERTAEVHRQAEQLRGLARELTRAEQRERKRLATILHDHIQQLIVAAQIQVSRVTRAADPAKRHGAAAGASKLLAEALEASRSLSVELSPPVLRESGFIGGLNWLTNRMREQHGLAVRLRADSPAEPADDEARVLLFECARELLLNVAKHAQVAQAEVTLTRPNAGEMRLSVADAGRGFDPDGLKALRPDEMSFGLFSIQERLAHIGGRMDLESAPGVGTRVELVVPVLESTPSDTVSATAADAPRTVAIEVRRRPKSCGVLIVDDHQILRDGLAGLLQVEPDIAIVGEAADGAQAVALAAELKPDVVIMDVNLGAGIDGIEATRRVLAADAGITVIGLSMHGDEDIADAMRAAGATAYVTKGGPPDDLIAAIRNHRRV